MSVGGRIFLGGLAVSAAGAGLVLAAGPRPLTAAAAQAHPILFQPLALGALITTIGLFIYVFQPAFDIEARARIPFDTLRTALAMLGVVVVVSNILSLPLVVVAGPKAASTGQLGPVGITYATVVSELPILGVLWLRVVWPRCRSWADLGLRPKELATVIPMGVAGGISLLILAGIVGAILSRFGIIQTQAQRFQGIQHAPLGLFALALLAGCVLAPFVEELFFRGYLFQSLCNRWGRAPAYVLSAALFALVHLNLQAAAPIFVIGLALAFLFEESGTLYPGMIAHGLNNLVSFSLLYFAGIKG